MTEISTLSSEQALLFLGAEPNLQPDALLELFEDAVFEETRYFMRRAFIPKLSEARRRRLHTLERVQSALGIRESVVPPSEWQAVHSTDIFEEFQTAADLSALLRAYHALESRMKHALSSTFNPSVACEIYAHWEKGFFAFSEAFIVQFETQYGEKELHSETRLSEWIDYNDLMSFWNPEQCIPSEEMHRYYSRLVKLRRQPPESH